MAKLIIKTPHGDFNRTTKTAYTHAVVRKCPRAERENAECAADPAKARYLKIGVNGRWEKDRRYAVTWHGSEAAARAAASKPYLWDAAATVLGIFPVEAQ